MRVFWLAKAKLRRVYDESTESAEEIQRAGVPSLRLEAIDFGKRIHTEKLVEADESAPRPNAVFDNSGNFLIYPTILGIKVIPFWVYTTVLYVQIGSILFSQANLEALSENEWDSL